MEEFQDWINYVKPTDMTTEIRMEIQNSLNEVIQDNSPAATMESVRQRVEELVQGVRFDCQAADHVRSVVIDLQEKLCITNFVNFNSRTPEVRDSSPQIREMNQDQGSPTSNPASRQREIVRMWIKRLEKQILQLISVRISHDQVGIALLKKCKTVEIPVVNSAIGNVQKALQKYVGFYGMNSEYCDKIEILMDQAEAWCLDIEDLYNKTEVHPHKYIKGRCCGCWYLLR